MASEQELIDSLVGELHPHGVLIGPGDDAAVMAPPGNRPLAMCSDLLVEDVHFERRYASPADIGFKAAGVTLSDLAAIGARALYMTVDVMTPDSDPRIFRELGQGLRQACEPCGCAVVGGDVSRAPLLALSTTAVGELPGQPFLRSGLIPGDLLAVTGSLGDSAAGFRALRAGIGKSNPLIRRHLRPVPRLDAAAWLVRANLVTAAIDVSDGLLNDLGHLCRQSRVDAEIDLGSLPLSNALLQFCGNQKDDPVALALSGGEDYELLFGIRPAHRLQLLEAPFPVHFLGAVLPPSSPAEHPIRLRREHVDVTADYQRLLMRPGWTHFD